VTGTFGEFERLADVVNVSNQALPDIEHWRLENGPVDGLLDFLKADAQGTVHNLFEGRARFSFNALNQRGHVVIKGDCRSHIIKMYRL
jgi:hypothetical protein